MTIFGRFSSILSVFAVLGLIALAVYGGWHYLMSPAAGPTAPATMAFPVETVVVERRPMIDKIETLGTTRAQEAVGIRPLSGGRLISLNFQPGDQVETGAVLARLDYEIQEAAVAEARATLTETERSLARAQSLRRSQAVSQATVDELESNRDGAKARLEAATKDLDERTIRAPFAGVVGFNEVDVGARISEGDLLTTLDDLSAIRVVFQVPERYYGRVHLNQTVNATTPAFPDQTFQAVITHIDSRIAEETRAFRVWATHPNRTDPLPAGLTVNVDIVLETRPALLVPEEGVVSEAGGTVVFVIKTDDAGTPRAHRRPVETGIRTKNAVEVRSGLSEGETVVRLGVQRLRDGMPVRILNEGAVADSIGTPPTEVAD